MSSNHYFVDSIYTKCIVITSCISLFKKDCKQKSEKELMGKKGESPNNHTV